MTLRGVLAKHQVRQRPLLDNASGTACTVSILAK